MLTLASPSRLGVVCKDRTTRLKWRQGLHESGQEEDHIEDQETGSETINIGQLEGERRDQYVYLTRLLRRGQYNRLRCSNLPRC